MPFDTAHVGSSRDSEEFRVNSYRLAQFAESLERVREECERQWKLYGEREVAQHLHRLM